MAGRAARVVVLHPDLGIGGAERLIVSLAVALKHHGHSVHLLTAHHDVNHCFEETRDGTLPVQCVGDWLPRSILGKFYALFAYIRMIYAAIYLQFFSHVQYDVLICDQISACIPFIKLFSPTAKVLFYCHFPDQLLTDRKSWVKRVYRAPLDWLEEKTTGMADVVLVNSQFTGEIFKSTFKSLAHIRPTVLYPSQQKQTTSRRLDPHLTIKGLSIDEDQIECVFLSINRYERKKNIALALEAFATLLKKVSHSDRRKVHLILSGGYDTRVQENVDYFAELEILARRLDIEDNVTFLRSCSDEEKENLLQRCTCLIYTPDREHFGIVPIEAMQAGKPVIAVRSGGPTETILDKKTGFLCEQDAESFASAMERFVHDTSLSQTMGALGKQHVKENFSFESFSSNINNIINGMLGTSSVLNLEDKFM